MKFFVHIISNGECFSLEDSFIIGRSESADVTLSDDKISGKHLLVNINGQDASIKDCDTSNGTRLNGRTLEPNVLTPVKIGDIIKLGRIDLLFSDREKIPADQLRALRPTNRNKGLKSNITFEDESNEDKTIAQDNLREISMDSDIFGGKEVLFEKHVVKDVDDISAREEAFRKKIRDYKIKIRKLNRSMEKVDEKINEKNELLEKVSVIEDKYKGKAQEIEDLKTNYEEFEDEWHSWNLKLKQYRREVKKLEEKKQVIGPKMEKYEEFLEDSKVKNQMMGEIKKLGRENLNDKKYELERNIKEAQEGIKLQEENIVALDDERKERKEQRRQNIIDEIKRLQAELEDDEAS